MSVSHDQADRYIAACTARACQEMCTHAPRRFELVGSDLALRAKACLHHLLGICGWTHAHCPTIAAGGVVRLKGGGLGGIAGGHPEGSGTREGTGIQQDCGDAGPAHVNGEPQSRVHHQASVLLVLDDSGCRGGVQSQRAWLLG
jgi:hypothetical protein